MNNAISWSEIRAFRQCPLKHRIEYVSNLADPKPPKTWNLGTVVHAMLEERYRQLMAGEVPDVERIVKARNLSVLKMRAAGIEFPDEDWERAGWIYSGYHEAYEGEPEWSRILAVELKIRVPMGTAARRTLYLNGTIDLVAQDRAGRVWIVDHKTVGQRDVSTSGMANEFALADQFLLYTAAIRRMSERQRVALWGLPDAPVGAIHNAIRTDRLKRPMTTAERFHRHWLSYTDPELASGWNDALLTGRQIMAARRGREFESHPSPSDCKWQCGAVQAHVLARKRGERLETVLERDYLWGPREERYPT